MARICQLGHPVLRTIAAPVIEPIDNSVWRLVRDMHRVLLDEKGIGIAAPQIGVSKQVFIVAPNQVVNPPYTSLDTGLVVINPTISALTDTVTHEWEGCLSIPGIRGYIPRRCHILVEYTTLNGERVSETYTDFTARIFLHEYDHLMGLVFLDRVESIKTDVITDQFYDELMADSE